MSVNDPISDLITRIRNGQAVRLAKVTSPSSRMRKDVLDVLAKEGYIAGYEESEVRKGISELSISLRYYDGEPVIKKINRISKPGLRQYAPVSKLPRVESGLGILIVSTSHGVMADHEARAKNFGGEILCEVF